MQVFYPHPKSTLGCRRSVGDVLQSTLNSQSLETCLHYSLQLALVETCLWLGHATLKPLNSQSLKVKVSKDRLLAPGKSSCCGVTGVFSLSIKTMSKSLTRVFGWMEIGSPCGDMPWNLQLVMFTRRCIAKSVIIMILGWHARCKSKIFRLLIRLLSWAYKWYWLVVHDRWMRQAVICSALSLEVQFFIILLTSTSKVLLFSKGRDLSV